MTVVLIREEDELRKLINSQKRVVAYFTSPQLRSFTVMSGELDDLSSQFKSVKCLLVDVDVTPFVLMDHDIPRLPAFKFFKDGIEVCYKDLDSIWGVQHAFESLIAQ
ncbi:hypothetical protein GGI17_003225 [Coemansia sp. S146]|nr:hypothetical protein GGI17_003225 [Coemansia sp. S146]